MLRRKCDQYRWGNDSPFSMSGNGSQSNGPVIVIVNIMNYRKNYGSIVVYKSGSLRSSFLGRISIPGPIRLASDLDAGKTYD